MTAPPALTCRELVELVTEYFEGALSGTEQARFDEHISACPGCQRYLLQMRATIAAAGRLQEDDVLPEAQAELLAAFRDWRSGRTNGATQGEHRVAFLERILGRFRRR
ncbi:MAG: zf-HC2 domain-containing protein [Dehalococcoidia bacterium]|nr:zf-HC2 domain-containing protein [Dehalococcoidia bacterium]